MKKIIAIINDKGGVAKSTTTINVSALLSLAGFKILVIDASKQINTSIILGGDTNFDYHIGNLLINDVPIYEAIYETVYNNIHLLPGTREIRAFRQILNTIKENLGPDKVTDRLQLNQLIQQNNNSVLAAAKNYQPVPVSVQLVVDIITNADWGICVFPRN